MDNNNITYDELLRSIEHWNEYRVPILKISHPDASLNFHGAMRFYFQDSGQKVATKCVNVTSADTTKDVIDVLIEKFRPDMRMLSVPQYGLYEIHENGDERKLEPNERPLFVQLEWNKDDREGRFLLRRMDEKTRDLAAQTEEPSLMRKLSKKEKKKQEKLTKQQQKEQEKANAAASKLAAKNKNGIAKKLYNELPETSFTRSISNPEAVMKRRRAQKLEKRLHEFSQEGGQESGGTLRIFGKAIDEITAYKTLLLSTSDTASSVVKQMLEKYGKDDEDPQNYCLVQLFVPHSATISNGDDNSGHDLNTGSGVRESLLEDTDCPLLIDQNHDKSKGLLSFHIRHRPADWQKRRKKKPPRTQQNSFHPLVVQQLNQRLQMNNVNSDQYRDQNSPQNSSQTSGSLNHDNNPLPPPFETVHSMPTMHLANNGNMMPYPPNYQQPQVHPHSMSTSTLPRQFVNGQPGSGVRDIGGTMQRQSYSHQNMINQANNQFGQMIPCYRMPIGQQPMQPQFIPVASANDQILPALIQVREDVEDIFLSKVITHIRPTDITFRLAPTYVLYMVSRYRASTLFHPELQAPSRAELFVPFTRKIAALIREVIDVHEDDQGFLAFWLANSLDLSHFYKQDKHLSHFTLEAQKILYDSIETSFKYLLACKQRELDQKLEFFFDGQEDHVGPKMNHPNMKMAASFNSIIDFLEETMATMRKNRVNASLTIILFSHLFHHISKWLFDRLIGVYDSQFDYSMYCNRIWGEKLNRRLGLIVGWSEKHGLERAAIFHLARVTQVTLFLARRYPPRIVPKDVKDAYESCNKLNPVQLRALLCRYQPDPQNASTINAIVRQILYHMDYSFVGGHPLEEELGFELKTQFLIPDDGYSSELLRYIPNGLLDFVSYLSRIRVNDQELCIFTLQPSSSGFWTVYFKDYQPDRPEIIVIQLRKQDDSMGLSIMAAKGEGQDHHGIYIKKVVKNGAAAMDGRLQAGDQLLEVDGNSLQDINQDLAVKLMKQTGPIVTLKIAKQAAIYHNVSDMINSTPDESIIIPQQVLPEHIPQNFIPPAPFEQMPIPDRKLLPPPQMHSIPAQPLDRQPPPPPEMHHPMDLNGGGGARMVQFAPQNRLINTIPHQDHRPASMQQINRNQPLIQEQRQVHFQPPPPAVMLDDQASTSAINPTSPLKSPKKVSWVDTQPHQSLHTLIPPSPSLASSPNPQAPSPSQLEALSLNAQEGECEEGDEEAANHQYRDNGQSQNYLTNNYNSNGNHEFEAKGQTNGVISNGNVIGHQRSVQYDIEEEDEDEEGDEDDGSNPRRWNPPLDQPQQQQQQQPHPPPQTNGHTAPTDDMSGGAAANSQPTPNSQLDTTAESLTLEDIDEVLSSKTHNNWIEDSAGVIGTQEVYNDPRQRIVKEREGTKADVNIEKLSFHDKLKMFNISSKK